MSWHPYDVTLMKDLLNVSQEALALNRESLAVNKEILEVLKADRKLVAIQFLFEGEPIDMPLTLQKSAPPDAFFIVGTDASGNLGAQLAAGQTVAVVSADLNTIVVTMDPAPKAVSGTGTPDDGVQSVASGTVAVGPTPVLNSPINLTATVSNPDGSAAETETDTVTIVPVTPGVAVSVGDVFGSQSALSTLKGALQPAVT